MTKQEIVEHILANEVTAELKGAVSPISAFFCFVLFFLGGGEGVGGWKHN